MQLDLNSFGQGSPSRCLLSLDLINMFNKISRENLFEIIASNFPELLHLISML
jgi:hypothetical protein